MTATANSFDDRQDRLPRAVNHTVLLRERTLWVANAMPTLRWLVTKSGLALPDRIVVGVGDVWLPNVAGECWAATEASGGMPVIRVSDAEADPLRVLCVALHELVHAAEDCQETHGQWFAGWAARLGFVAPWSVAAPGTSLRKRLWELADALDRYPFKRAAYVLTDDGRIIA